MREARHGVIDEIDLIALGHMPGGASMARSRPLANLDLTAHDAAAARTLAIAEVTRMVPGDAMVLLTASEPYALLDALHTHADGRCMFEYIATGPETWATAITRVGA
ncbi:hypothetical protein [Demequina litorisediminis]|uniref:DUF2249 domain-containing protein n=1 Tax=Demequina litorisediminis TaxID=1849022 RepID=A0ABQ6IAF5_9MICO|nr:hypothetical protein [Demequina litorisediminis]GMA34048.1 hypothetical protein GCM10025876_02520 [Demequina litorisediminis]